MQFAPAELHCETDCAALLLPGDHSVLLAPHPTNPRSLSNRGVSATSPHGVSTLIVSSSTPLHSQTTLRFYTPMLSSRVRPGARSVLLQVLCPNLSRLPSLKQPGWLDVRLRAALSSVPCDSVPGARPWTPMEVRARSGGLEHMNTTGTDMQFDGVAVGALGRARRRTSHPSPRPIHARALRRKGARSFAGRSLHKASLGRRQCRGCRARPWARKPSWTR